MLSHVGQGIDPLGDRHGTEPDIGREKIERPHDRRRDQDVPALLELGALALVDRDAAL